MLEFDAALSTAVEVNETDRKTARLEYCRKTEWPALRRAAATRCIAIGTPRIISAWAKSICWITRCCASRSRKRTSSRACWDIGALPPDKISFTCI